MHLENPRPPSRPSARPPAASAGDDVLARLLRAPQGETTREPGLGFVGEQNGALWAAAYSGFVVFAYRVAERGSLPEAASHITKTFEKMLFKDVASYTEYVGQASVLEDAAKSARRTAAARDEAKVASWRDKKAAGKHTELKPGASLPAVLFREDEASRQRGRRLREVGVNAQYLQACLARAAWEVVIGLPPGEIDPFFLRAPDDAWRAVVGAVRRTEPAAIVRVVG